MNSSYLISILTQGKTLVLAGMQHINHEMIYVVLVCHFSSLIMNRYKIEQIALLVHYVLKIC
jgi:hypothetical protein